MILSHNCHDSSLQHQFCASQSKGEKFCTPLTGLPGEDVSLLNQFTDLTGLQSSLMKLLWSASFLNDVTNAASLEDLSATGMLSFTSVTYNEYAGDCLVRCMH